MFKAQSISRLNRKENHVSSYLKGRPICFQESSASCLHTNTAASQSSQQYLQLCGVWRISPLDSLCELQEMKEGTTSGKPSFTLSFSINKKRLWEYCIYGHRAYTYAVCKIKEDFRSNSNFCKKFHKHFDGLTLQLGAFPTVHFACGDCWDLPVHSIHSHSEKLQTASPNTIQVHYGILSTDFCFIFCFL